MSEPKPAWLKVRRPGHGSWGAVRRALAAGGLHTVCEEARCPNRAECWGAGTATLLLLGDVCTRGCRFCSVARGTPPPLAPDEPARAARCAEVLALDYVVLTSVTRDDLPDGGAAVFAATIAAVRALPRRPRVEVLIPDLRGAALATVVAARPDVLAHNLEVVRRLTPRVRHPRCDYDRSLAVLEEARELDPRLALKSSLLLGLGETPDELLAALGDLRRVGVDTVVLGQYLRPTRENVPVERYVPPEEFAELRARALALGFAEVVAEPLARTSYHAREAEAARRARVAAAEGRAVP
ncbi:MAG: lipoyl synthase [Deltaproteobacteria bacterium]|nr:lipoyl synthase [Deltaproteobacteria bacterium]